MQDFAEIGVFLFQPLLVDRVCIYLPESLDAGAIEDCGPYFSNVEIALDVVGFATNVRLSDRTERDFSDFCVSLVAGYGWSIRNNDGRSLQLENEGAAMRIWPVTSTAAARALLRRRSEYGRDSDLIVSNQTIPAALQVQANFQDFGLAHYSELGRWMKNEYRMGVFKDL